MGRARQDRGSMPAAVMQNKSVAACPEGYRGINSGLGSRASAGRRVNRVSAEVGRTMVQPTGNKGLSAARERRPRGIHAHKLRSGRERSRGRKGVRIAIERRVDDGLSRDVANRTRESLDFSIFVRGALARPVRSGNDLEDRPVNASGGQRRSRLERVYCRASPWRRSW
jgi:hypothetical protein